MCEYDRYCRCRDMVVIKKKGMVIKMKNTVSLKLVEKAAKGNREAFGELIIMHQEYLYKLAYMYTKNEQDALDAVQECAMRAMISMDKLREPQYFKTWITRILINSIYRALPPMYKTVVILQYFHGMKIKDIAEVMNIPQGSVKAYLHRAKELLRRQLDGEEDAVSAEREMQDKNHKMYG